MSKKQITEQISDSKRYELDENIKAIISWMTGLDDRVSKIDTKLNTISTILEIKLDTFVSEDRLEIKLNAHKEDCDKKSIPDEPKSQGIVLDKKTFGMIISVIIALISLAAMLVEKLPI